MRSSLGKHQKLQRSITVKWLARGVGGAVGRPNRTLVNGSKLPLGRITVSLEQNGRTCARRHCKSPKFQVSQEKDLKARCQRYQ
mmetsp:Transcript_100827/g.197880  ORF Transcript_100827/g.197880 Transcript_100827/m.197880 type:complete len:84 (-) Transcript_100827:901-1152(-)